MKKRNEWIWLMALALLALSPQVAIAARDLSSATSSAVSEATNIAQVASVLGVMAGAIAYQIPGAAHFGQRLLTGGLIGAGLAFGGPSLMNLFRAIFGA